MSDTKNQPFALSNNESIVKNYRCTWSYHFFSRPELGYLTITNKRVIYHSRSESSTSESTVLAEMPVDDVAGVSASVGNSINWMLVIVLTAVLYFLLRGLAAFLPGWMTSWVLIILLLLPGVINFLVERNVLNERLVSSISEQVATSLPEQLKSITRPEIIQRIVNVTLGISLFLAVIRLFFQSQISFRVPILPVLIVGALVFLAVRTYSNRQRTFTLILSSKTALGSGIYIPGGGLGLGGAEGTPGLVSASPAEDAETIVSELGAMLTDIRLMGDLGLQKWSNSN